MSRNNDDRPLHISFAQSIANRHLRHDQERMLATLLDQLDGMVYRCRHDAHWTMEFVSVGCFALTGYRPDELLLNSVVSYDAVTHPEDRERVRTEIRCALADRRRFEIEYRICRADGAVRWVSERGMGIYRDDGSLEALQGIIVDVSRRMQNEQALHNAQARYRDIVENAVGGIFQSTHDGRYLSVNPALARIYGYQSPEEMITALRDIERQLYVDPERRKDFVRLMAANGVINNFESQIRRKDGAVIWISENARAVRDASGRTLYYEGTVEDITARKSYEMRLAHQATHDPLTGLPNRLLFTDRLQQALMLGERESARVGVVFIDLDNFKDVNDSLGHEAGDALLRTMAARLTACVRETDTVTRLGGDEFVLLLQGLPAGNETVCAVMSRVLAEVAQPVQIGERELSLTCSIGVSLFPEDGRDVETLLKHADTAMYQAKHIGRNNFQFFTSAFNHRIIDRLDLAHRLRGAIENREFLLHYQPRLDLATKTVMGAEALIRWKGEQGLISPARFIPIAEENGLIEAIGKWVLETACRQAAAWQRMSAGVFHVSVNVSPRQFRDDRLPQLVGEILRATGVDPRLIELEITEGCLAADPQKFIATLKALKQVGVKLAIDDFGSGYSSMAYLKSFPVDRLKVDRTFVTGLTAGEKDRSIFRAIVSLGHNLGLRVVAEGVETAEQYYFLRETGCDEVQGYYFGMPVPPEDIDRLIGAFASRQSALEA